MILLLSGEGPTDLGHCDLSFSQCSNDESGTFISGVLTYIIDDIFNSKMNYSIRETLNSVHFVHKSHLCEKIKKQSGGKKLVMMRGAKKAPETNFYFNNAKSLGLIALELQEKEKCPVIAILFRDSDGTRSTASNDWKTKYDSMVLGFDESGCNTGVPMLAKPKSEAWLLAACKNDPYQHCHLLENESGNDNSTNSLKNQLSERIGAHSSQALINWITNIKYDYTTVSKQMPSFTAFYQRFLTVLDECCKC
jgi:hypothetical protein